MENATENTKNKEESGNGEEKSFNILMISRDPFENLLLKKFLQIQEENYTIHHVRDGIDALDFLEHKDRYAEAPRPDLIIVMPDLSGLDGYQVLNRINRDKSLGQIPRIILDDNTNPITENHPHMPLSPFCYLVKAYFDRRQVLSEKSKK
ncbi:hypothetical protein BVX98_02055 [bacterium F11]|nr:hypothetical protein BVX98_02055 [bacterium F11]